METHSHHSLITSWRSIGIGLSLALFALSLAQLLTRPGEDTATWRGLALSSLYLVLCLSQRRLFKPARTSGNPQALGK